MSDYLPFQYQALAEPLNVQASAPETVTMDKWWQNLSVPTRRVPSVELRFTANTVPLFPASPLASPALAWEPEFPDFAKRWPRRGPEGGNFAPTLPLGNAPSVSAWDPAYQDRVPPRERRPEGGMVEPVSPQQNSPQFSWQPEYPDSTVRRPWRRGLDGVLPPFQSAVAPQAPDMSWSPRFPDVLRLALRRMDGGSFDCLEIVQQSSPTLSWQPRYQDYVSRLLMRPGGDTVLPPFQPGAVPPAPMLSWSPRYPDILRPTVRRIEGGGFDCLELVQQNSPALSWHPEVIDYAWRKALRPGGDTVLPPTQPAPVGAPALSWYPRFPDLISRLKLRQGESADPPFFTRLPSIEGWGTPYALPVRRVPRPQGGMYDPVLPLGRAPALDGWHYPPLPPTRRAFPVFLLPTREYAPVFVQPFTFIDGMESWYARAELHSWYAQVEPVQWSASKEVDTWIEE